MGDIDMYKEIIDLTRQDSLIALTASFTQAVKNNTSAADVKFYELHKVNKPSGESDSKDSEQDACFIINPIDTKKERLPIDYIEGVSECISRKAEVVIEIDQMKCGQRVLAPVMRDNKILGVVHIECGVMSDEDFTSLQVLIRIFENLSLLLNSKERDSLTGLLNRQSFDMTVNQILMFYRSPFKRQSDKTHQACLAVLDIDHFKRINDTYGHLIGDEVLLMFAQIMQKSFRFTDFLFRYGGEEFVVIIVEVTKETAFAVLERFRKAVESYVFPQVGKVTLSSGYVVINGEDAPATIVEKADKALYYAKDAGRNRVCSYDDLVTDGVFKEESRGSSDIELW
ncbi:diguanylate cyclase [Candidatus Magnetoovum chiemensis]|nr:diguanylate cyclase [Candidatus Magnetoovum chiemensis]